MVFAGVSYHDKTTHIIIDNGVKVYSKFYINKVVKPFVDKDIHRMFPGDQSENMVFHQDVVSSPTSNQALAFLRERNISLWVYHSDRLVNAKIPDAAVMDFVFWGTLKTPLKSAQFIL